MGVTFSDDTSCERITGNRAALAQFEVQDTDNLSASAPDAGSQGRQVRYFLDGQEVPAADLPLQRAVAENREVAPVELEVHLPSGRRWFVSASAAPLRGRGGAVTGGVAVTVDVTARNQAEEALRRAFTQLAETDRRKDEFIAVLSHELRNPLSPIRYALPLIQREPLPAHAARAADIIDRQVSHLTRLVDDLLDVSRVTHGKIELRRHPVLLSTVLAAAVEASAPEVAAGRHQLSVEASDGPLWVNADTERLAQVVTNLINNSARYTPHGGHIRLDAVQDGDHAVIRVRDDGGGIAAEHLGTVFEMFQRGHHLTQTQGLGIGLALSKRLIEMHGGTITAHSAGLGCGAEFVVRLPLSPAPAPRPAVDSADSDRARPPPPRARRR